MKNKGMEPYQNFIFWENEAIIFLMWRRNARAEKGFEQRVLVVGGLTDAEISNRIKSFLHESKTRKVQWLVVIAQRSVLVKNVVIPSVENHEVRRMISWQIQTNFNSDKNILWDYQVIVQDKERSKVCLAGVDLDLLSRSWTILNSAGVRFVHFSADCFIKPALVTNSGFLGEGAAFILWSSQNRHELYVLNGSEVWGFTSFMRVDQLELKDRDLLVKDQIKMYLRLCEQQFQIAVKEGVVISGDNTAEMVTGIERDRPDIFFRSVDVQSLSKPKKNPLTFCWVPLDIQNSRQKTRQVRVWGTFIFLACLFAGLIGSFRAVQLMKDSAYIEQLGYQERGLRDQVAALPALEAQLAVLSEKINGRRIVSQWLEKIDGSRPASIYLSKMLWRAAEGLTMEGFASQDADIHEWQKQLASSRFFKDVILLSTQHQADGVVSFRMRCVLTEEHDQSPKL